jgi:ubiquitin
MESNHYRNKKIKKEKKKMGLNRKKGGIITKQIRQINFDISNSDDLLFFSNDGESHTIKV